MTIISVAVLLLNLSIIVAFITPKSEFLLEIDGNGIALSRGYGCVIEQKYGVDIGGKVKCWGEIISNNDVVEPPEDVSKFYYYFKK